MSDYKVSQSFLNKLSCRLIDPSNYMVTKINKVVLHKMNNDIQEETSVNQRKDTSSVFDWFVNIGEKNRTSFMVFDIESFPSPIAECLFKNTTDFAKQVTEISDYGMSLINQSRKTLLFNKNMP